MITVLSSRVVNLTTNTQYDRIRKEKRKKKHTHFTFRVVNLEAEISLNFETVIFTPLKILRKMISEYS